MKIDKRVEFTAACQVNGCFMTHAPSGAFLTRKQAVKSAKEDGWKVINKVTMCPDCISKLEEVKNAND